MRALKPSGGIMAKKKGRKKPKTEFSVKRIERKKTRHLKTVESPEIPGK
jgi:hypothetical protein